MTRGNFVGSGRFLLTLLAYGAACSSGASPGGERQPHDQPRQRSDGMQRQGTSRVRSIRDSTCNGSQLVNTTYHDIWGAGTAGRMILEVISDVTRKSCMEGALGTIAVKAWRDSVGLDAKPVEFSSTGDEGEFVDRLSFSPAPRFAPLFRIRTTACCSGTDTDEFFNLETGQLVFVSSAPLLQFVANGTVRYVAVLQDGPSDPVDSTVWKPNTALVLQYGDGKAMPQRLVIPGGAGAEYGIESFALEAPPALKTKYGISIGRRFADTIAVSGAQIRLRYGEKNSEATRELIVRIEGDKMITPP
jgi:hypothetical protein